MDEREIDWRGSTYKDLLEMPAKVRQTFGFALGLAQNNLPYEDAKTLSGFNPPLVEILEATTGIPTVQSIRRTSRTSFMSCIASKRNRPKVARCRAAIRKPSKRASPR